MLLKSRNSFAGASLGEIFEHENHWNHGKRVFHNYTIIHFNGRYILIHFTHMLIFTLARNMLQNGMMMTMIVMINALFISLVRI